jgi:predicted permease
VKGTNALYIRLPLSVQKVLSKSSKIAQRFLNGVWDFMNPPLWAMLVAIIVASVPALQRLFFDDGTFIRNSVTRAISQNGQVAVPLILVVLGANLKKRLKILRILGRKRS